MRSYFYKFLAAAALAAMLFTITGCLKDSCESSTPSKIYIPVYQPLTELRTAVKSLPPQDIEKAGKIYVYGHYIFLNELNKGIHIIDNTNPAAPRKIAFINIPGNVDMAVKGNVLYADSFMDLVALDITDPQQVKEAKRLQYIFPQRQYEYGIVSDTTLGVITTFVERDTVLTNTCNMPGWRGDYIYLESFNSAIVANGAKNNAPSATGKGGSLARFGLLNNCLYTVDRQGLQAFNVQNALQPVKRNNIGINTVVETIFPYGNHLFIGTQTGMLIYDAVNPEYPALKGQYTHITGCDPVAVENDRAYVTLRGGTNCRNENVNVLDVLDVKDAEHPALIKSYPMSSPYGVGVDGSRVFVCEGSNGLRFLDAQDPLNVATDKVLDNITAFDVIPGNNLLLVTAKDGLYQYDYSNPKSPRLLSKLGITVK